MRRRTACVEAKLWSGYIKVSHCWVATGCGTTSIYITFRGNKTTRQKKTGMTCAEPQMQNDVRRASEQMGGLVIALKTKKAG